MPTSFSKYLAGVVLTTASAMAASGCVLNNAQSHGSTAVSAAFAQAGVISDEPVPLNPAPAGVVRVTAPPSKPAETVIRNTTAQTKVAAAAPSALPAVSAIRPVSQTSSTPVANSQPSRTGSADTVTAGWLAENANDALSGEDEDFLGQIRQSEDEQSPAPAATAPKVPANKGAKPAPAAAPAAEPSETKTAPAPGTATAPAAVSQSATASSQPASGPQEPAKTGLQAAASAALTNSEDFQQSTPQFLAEAAPRQPVPPAPVAQPMVSQNMMSASSCPEMLGCPRYGVMCGPECCQSDSIRWRDATLVPWEAFAQGEYIGPARSAHIPDYHLRVDDQLDFVYRLTCVPSGGPYRLSVGDQLRIEFLTAEPLSRTLLIQPDGFITMPTVGQVTAAGRTISELRDDLINRYKNIINKPDITITPTIMNTTLIELRASVDHRYGTGGQSRQARVTPEGTVQLPALGSIPAQGLTLTEFKSEINGRYSEFVQGLEVTPVLVNRAPRYAYVTGEVVSPGRFPLEAPTTASQAIAMAGGWRVGADLKNVVVFRRDENWHLVATKLNLKSALFTPRPCPADEIYIRDSDIVIVPKSCLLKTDNFLQLLFTDAIYRVIPFSAGASINYTTGTFVP